MALAALTACSEDNSSAVNNQGDVDEDVAALTSNVSGIVRFASNVVVDSDLNDGSAQASNATPETAQVLQNNLVQVQGFVSELGEQGGNGPDDEDVYKVFYKQANRLLWM